jgi:hypothetical protein
MDNETKDWQVTRNCCTSGQCVECHQRGTPRPARIVHADRLTKAAAQAMVVGWRAYDPQASQMPAGEA